MFDHMLIEYRHYDDVVRGPSGSAVFYFLLRFDWVATLVDKKAFITRDVLSFISERSFTLLKTSPRSFVGYWRNGQMEKEVEICWQRALEQRAHANSKKSAS